MIKVLMLGWEFPPLFSGGLGVATYGIVKALSPKADIRLIIPTAADLSELQNVDVIGLNRVTAEEINLERIQYNFSFDHTEVYQLPVRVSPYHHINKTLLEDFSEDFSFLSPEKSVEGIHRVFVGNEVYGSNIMQKVYLFSKLADAIASDGDFDIIHAHDWITYPAGVDIKLRTGKPLVLHVHSLETDRSGHTVRNEIYKLEKKALEFADRIIAVSQYTRDQIHQHYQIDPAKISVVYNGIEPARKKRKPHRLKDKLVVFLGRLTHQKGPQFLLETAEKISRVYPGVKFVVAGAGDQFIPMLESAAYKKLGNKFIFTGFLSKAKVDEVLSMADVYFMPSVSEPFGISALEAAQFGVPGVLSSQSGAAEVIKGSLQADFWDTDKFANYIFALLSYAKLSTEISEKAKINLKELTWTQAGQKIMEVYRTVLRN